MDDGASWPAVLVLIGICAVTALGGLAGERIRAADTRAAADDARAAA